MDLDQILQLVILILFLGGGIVGQIVQKNKKQALLRHGGPTPAAGPDPVQEEIAERMRLLLSGARVDPKPKVSKPPVPKFSPVPVEAGKRRLSKTKPFSSDFKTMSTMESKEDSELMDIVNASRSESAFQASTNRSDRLVASLKKKLIQDPTMMVLGYEVFGPPIAFRKRSSLPFDIDS